MAAAPARIKGVRADRYGLRAYVKVNGVQVEKRFEKGTNATTINDWRAQTRQRLLSKKPAATGTMQADAVTYLAQVRAMPTFMQRSDHVEMWVQSLGPLTQRADVTAADIRTVLHGWRAKGLGPATCNKRRSALMHLWSTLDGKGASNPVRDVAKFRADGALPRGRDLHLVDGKLREAPHCRSRACCRVLLWTGLRPVELQRAQPEDLDRRQRTLIVRTAKGGRVRVVPMTSQALSAWTEFDQAEAWGKVPQAAPLNRWLKDHTGLEIRVYDLRHSYGTALALRQTRLDVIGSLMGHSTLELTKRYTLAAVTPDADLATQKLAIKLAVRGKAKRTA